MTLKLKNEALLSRAGVANLRRTRLGASSKNNWGAKGKRFILGRLKRAGAIVGELKRGSASLEIRGSGGKRFVLKSLNGGSASLEKC